MGIAAKHPATRRRRAGVKLLTSYPANTVDALEAASIVIGCTIHDYLREAVERALTADALSTKRQRRRVKAILEAAGEQTE